MGTGAGAAFIGRPYRLSVRLCLKVKRRLRKLLRGRRDPNRRAVLGDRSVALSEEYRLSGRFIRRGKAARLVIRIRQVGEGGTICETGDLRITARRF